MRDLSRLLTFVQAFIHLNGLRTSVKIEFDVCVFFLLRGIVMRSAFHPVEPSAIIITVEAPGSTNTCTLRTCMLAEGFCGVTSTESATKIATAKATVVKYPKTFCARTREECIAGFWLKSMSLQLATALIEDRDLRAVHSKAVLKRTVCEAIALGQI